MAERREALRSRGADTRRPPPRPAHRLCQGKPRNPVPHDEIRSNFLACAERTPKTLHRGNVERARDLIEDLETVTDVSQIPALLSPNSGKSS